MIKINNLSFSYPGSEDVNLKNINLEVNKGDFLAIIGNNGCGKSTLCKTLNGLIPHFFSGDFEGSVEICGLNTKEYNLGMLGTKIGYVYQDFENQIVRPTVLDDASFACLNYAMEDYKEKGRDALKMIGLIKKENDYVWQLSGGEKHLLALASMTALQPDILVLDEPIAQLDPQHAKKIYDVLKYLNEEKGKTIIVIEHHTEFIAKYCSHLVMMKEGEILWKMPAKKGLTRVEDLKNNNIFPPQVTIAGKYLQDKGIIKSRNTLPTTIEEGKIFFSELTIPKKSSKITEKNKNTEEAAVFRNVDVEYRAVKGENIKIINNFSLKIHRGDKIALIGTNGGGKSTIMKLMSGLLKPTQGDITVYGESIKGMTPEQISKKISLVYQNPEEMFIKDSIRGDIEFGMKARKVRNYEERTEELLELFHLKELSNRDGRLLSGGQMRRASLAVGIALNPSILLLDEPTANLDIMTRKEISNMLEHVKDIVETTIIATHDMQLVAEWADRIIVLDKGDILADGAREDIFNSKFVYNIGIQPPEIYNMAKILSPCAECYTVQDFIDYFGQVV